MKRVRLAAGILAVALLCAGLNLLVLKSSFFLPSVLIPLGAGLACGAAWCVLTVVWLARQAAPEGHALETLNAVASSVLFLGICVVLYAFAAHGTRAWDLTREGRRSLSAQTVQVLENLNKDVYVTAFFLRIDDELVSIARDKTERFLALCQTHTPQLHVEFLDPQVDRARLEGLNITHASTQGTVVVRCGARQKVITLQGASPRLEERDFTNALINVVRSAQPKVYFLTGHGERSIEDANEQTGGSVLKTLLEGEAYAAERTAILITRPEIPADCDILVINGLGLAGPQSDLHPAETRAIEEYLDRGGRLLVCIDPWQRVATGAEQTEQLLPWLARRYGIVAGDDIVVSPASRWAVELTPDTAQFPNDAWDSGFRGSFNAEHRITKNFDQKMLLSAARSVRLAEKMPAGTVGMELLRTTPEYYAENDLSRLKTTGKATQSAEEPGGPLSMAVAVSARSELPAGDTGQPRDARIVVVGDSDFLSNGQLTVIPGHLNFVLNTVAWLSESEELIAIRPSGKEDAPVLLSAFDQRVVVYVAVLGTLQAVLAAAAGVYALRRKYQ